MFITDPKSVRYDERVKAGKATHQRRSTSPIAPRPPSWRRRSSSSAPQYTADAIKKAIANKGTLPAPPRTRPQGSSSGRPWALAIGRIGDGARRSRARHERDSRSRLRVDSFSSTRSPRRRVAPAQDPRSMGGGNCANNPYNCADTPNPLPASRHGVDRRDDVDGRPRRAQGGQDHGDHLHRRHGAERPVAGDRQAQLRAAHQLRRHRAQAGERAVRADRQARARGPHRAAERPHDQPGHDQPARGNVPGAAHRHRATA